MLKMLKRVFCPTPIFLGRGSSMFQFRLKQAKEYFKERNWRATKDALRLAWQQD